jgi:hypothetical protein
MDVPVVFRGSPLQIEELFGGIPLQLVIFLLKFLDDEVAVLDLGPESLLGAVVALHPAVFAFDFVVGSLEVVDFAVCAVQLLLDKVLVEVADQFVQVHPVI